MKEFFKDALKLPYKPNNEVREHENQIEDLLKKHERAATQTEEVIAHKEYQVALSNWGISISESLINTALGITKALPNIPLSVIVGVLGAVQTGLIMANMPKKAAEFGLNEIIDTPTNLSVAEAGPELIQVTPLGENMLGPGGGGSTINISFEGNVLSDDFIELEAIPKIREAVLRGESLS